MDKDRGARIEAVFKSGVEKRREIMATIVAVRGEPYADAIYNAVIAFNFTNCVAKACNGGDVAPMPRAVFAILGPDAQGAVSELLFSIPAIAQHKKEDVVRDVNALLDLVTEAAAQIGSRK
jgi:hypothetical protein